MLFFLFFRFLDEFLYNFCGSSFGMVSMALLNYINAFFFFFFFFYIFFLIFFFIFVLFFFFFFGFFFWFFLFVFFNFFFFFFLFFRFLDEFLYNFRGKSFGMVSMALLNYTNVFFCFFLSS